MNNPRGCLRASDSHHVRHSHIESNKRAITKGALQWPCLLLTWLAQVRHTGPRLTQVTHKQAAGLYAATLAFLFSSISYSYICIRN